MNKVNLRSVLIVDDNEIDIFIQKRVLEFSNLCEEIISMQTGREALNYLKKEDEVPNLILLDLNMPLIDGFHFLLEFAKMSEKVKEQTNIVVLTSSNNEHDRKKIEANPYVMLYEAKPLTDETVEKIKTTLDGPRRVRELS